MSNDPRGIPFGSVGKRFVKFAEKKLQKGITNFLESHPNAANTANTTNVYYPDTPTNPAAANTANTTNVYYPDIPTNPEAGYPTNPEPYYPTNPETSNTTSSSYETTSAQPPPAYPQNTNLAPPPPAPFSEPFPQPQESQSQTPELINHSFNSGTSNHANAALFNAAGPIITQDLLLQMTSRVPSACISLGQETVTEARKGLSRVLSPTHEDIELFATQLKNTDFQAVEPNWNTLDDELPCFAITYVQHPSHGRYKFSNDQWQNFHRAVQAIAHAGIKQFRVWLDQCLWIRDASQASWAHTGILPYVLWPVIALGTKLPGGERTTDSFVRMWPFVEEVSALWGMGLIITSEYRSHDQNSGIRPWLSYNSRVRTEPEQNLSIVLLNIFHGAADGLKTGWEDDVRELKEMAQANAMYATKNIIIGSDWKERFARIQPRESHSAIGVITMPVRTKYLGGIDVFLDDSRVLKCTNWNGVKEWLSGNEGPVPISQHDKKMLQIGMKKYNVITDVAEYQLLKVGHISTVLWLLVAMHGRSSYFSRGRVAWTKVASGLGSCSLAEMLGNRDLLGIQRVLRALVKNPKLQVLSATQVQKDIEWI